MTPRRPDSIARALLVAALCLTGAGCAHGPAPAHGPVALQQARRQSFGGWLHLQLRGAPGTSDAEDVAGEFLAVGPDSQVRLLDEQSVHAIPRGDIVGARLTAYESEARFDLWTMRFCASPDTSALAASDTLRSWRLSGTMTNETLWESGESTPPRCWNDLRVYARFPQGWPAGADTAGMATDPQWKWIVRRLRADAARAEARAGPARR